MQDISRAASTFEIILQPALEDPKISRARIQDPEEQPPLIEFQFTSSVLRKRSASYHCVPAIEGTLTCSILLTST